MENTIDSFFNEIDQIAPPKDSGKGGCDWQECFDSSSGFSYYWNVKTDQVTWDAPVEFMLWKQENPNHDSVNQKPSATPLFPSALSSSTKIYKLQSDAADITNNRHELTITKKVPDKSEKVVLIPSYGDGSDSEAEIDKEVKSDDVVKSHLPPKSLKENCNLQSTNNTEEDDIDLLTKLQNRAKILKDLGGELPPDVKKIVEQNGSFGQKECQHKVKKEVSGFSLVAGYGESDEEDEGNFKALDASAPTTSECKAIGSTLFPVLKPIDVKQFLESEKEPEIESIDAKAFHRKRRIGIDFNLEKPKSDISPIETERQGLGFKSETESNLHSNTKQKINYPGFQSGGLIFVKSDVLNPANEIEKKEPESDVNKAETMKKIEETHKTLNEKLTFLSEGRDPVSPVQIIIIQMETLYEAMKAGSLTVTYLYKWLKETCSELVKLEKDAAPNGWLLQWDRINKRYYYRNQQTGESQWQYPQSDIVGGDEAMDICTTPPPTITESIINEPGLPLPSAPISVRPPPPPRIKSPTPPPPPIISKNVKQRKKVKCLNNIAPVQDLPPLPCGEPLPPGVDSLPEPSHKEENEGVKKDSLGSEINSFYSDLAAMETVVGNTDSEINLNTELVLSIDTSSNNVTKKKKKSKVKLVEGLAMKKKGVSKLVERWKNVQKDYN